MGIKTIEHTSICFSSLTLKNLPTTWGLRRIELWNSSSSLSLKNLPTTWGLRRSERSDRKVDFFL